MSNSYTAIILAAGKGTRLRPLTNEIPKCMVPVAGKPILERQLEVFTQLGIKNIIVVTGYMGEKISGQDFKKIHNTEFDTTNMVYSLMCARENLTGNIIVSYGDIVFSKNILQKLMRNEKDMVIASDEEWFSYWKKRFEDPLSDAETFKRGAEKSVESLGQKPLSKDKIEGQFIGLMKFSDKGCQSLKDAYDKCRNSNNYGNAWGSGRELTKTYMTDILNHFAGEGMLYYEPIKRGWFEVDDVSDLMIANQNI